MVEYRVELLIQHLCLGLAGVSYSAIGCQSADAEGVFLMAFDESVQVLVLMVHTWLKQLIDVVKISLI